jgi:hypothetical protein
MKKFFICILIAFSVFNTAFAESKVITQTQETDITCTIDGLFIESYAIDGFMYLPVERLSDYGFNLNKNEEVIELKRNEIVYFDDLYEKKDNDANLPVYENTTPVIIDEKIANTYVIEDRIVIQADELLAFGDVSWNENTQTVEISIIANELKNAFEKAEDKVTVTEGMTQISGQMQNNKWNGIVRTSGFQSMTYFGYMKDGEYEGVVYGYREHQPYLAALYELKTVRNGMKNGYCRYITGYNNKPEPPQTIKVASGIYENDKLKNGEYTIYTDFNMNTSTFEVKDFNEQIVSSTRYGYEYEKSLSQVFYNGELIDFDVAPIMENDRTLIPLRGLFEKMGAVVEWDGQNQTAIVTKDDMILSVKIDHYGAKVDDSCKYMDVPARLVESRTMIPLRFLSEELGYTVIWNENDHSINIK